MFLELEKLSLHLVLDFLLQTPEKSRCLQPIRTHDLCDTDAMLYRLSYQVTQLAAGQLVGHVFHRKKSMNESTDR